jgi:exosome complex component CSL4
MSSTQAKSKSGQIVVPGDRLGVIEEFTPGPGTYEQEGTIYSAATGQALMDLLNKQVSVYPKAHVTNVPHVGSSVIGQVAEVQSKQATIRIFQVDDRLLTGFFSGLLHIGDVSQRYVESMYDVCKAGDLVRARVISEKNRVIHLTTNDKDLGVIYAFCSHCGHSLDQKRFIMRCPECGNSERRKTSADYGKGEI